MRYAVVRHRRCVVLLTTLFALASLGMAARPALAADKSTVAASMAQQAGKAYESGDYTRAASLYFNAWRTSHEPSYLWSLARSEDLAGQPDEALTHYRTFMEAPGGLRDRVPRAKEYIEAIDKQRVDARAKEADAAQRSGDARLAATLYLDAYHQAPARYELLFKAAVAEQGMEDWSAAESHLQAYLKAAPINAMDRVSAQARLESGRRHSRTGTPEKAKPAIAAEPPRAAPPAPKATPTPVVTKPGIIAVPAPVRVEPAKSKVVYVAAEKPAQAPQPGRAGGITAIVLGSTAVVAAVVLFGSAASDKAAFDNTFSTGTTGPRTTLSQNDAQNQVSSINTRMGAAVGIGVLGAGAIGLGVRLLSRSSKSLVFGPGPGSAGVSAAWAF